MSKHYRLLKKNIKKSLVIGKWKISTEEDVQRLELSKRTSLSHTHTVNTQSYHHYHHHHHHHLHHSALSFEIPGGFELKLCSNTCTKSFSILNLLCNLELVILIFSSLELKGIFLFFLFFKLIGHLGLLGWSEISL